MHLRKLFRISPGMRLAALLTLLLHGLHAQYFDFRWSGEIVYSNHREGFFTGYIDANSGYVYALNSNYAVSPLNRDKKVKLIAYDKLTMAEKSSVSLKGYPENAATEELLSSLRYFRTVVLEDRVLVFWTRLINTDSTKTEELYVESYKPDLEPENAVSKIYTTVQKVDFRQSEFAQPSIVIVSHTRTGKVVIGSEIHRPFGNVSFRSLVLTNRLAVSSERMTELPAKCGEVQDGLLAGYELGEDGNIYIRSSVPLTKEERYELRPNEPGSYMVLTVLNPVSGRTGTLELRGKDKTITDFKYLVTASGAKVLGFFGDLEKDPTGIDKQGIFYADIASDNLQDVKLNYSYFEKTTLNKLFPKSRGGRRKNSDQPTTEEQLNTRFDIEHIYRMEDGSYILFFTRKYNYTEITSRSGMDGRNIYKTDYFCEKNNVSAIRINDQGKIQWTSNIERSITYEGTDISDLKIVQKSGKFFVFYGTDPKVLKSKKKPKKNHGPELRDNLDYATFDAQTGRAKKLNLEVNEDRVSLRDRKLVDPRSITVYDDKFYFSRISVRQKPLWYVANVLFFPSIYYSVLSGNVKYGKGELAVLCLLDKKPDKKAKRK